MNDVMIGQFTLSVLLTTITGIVYKFFDNPDGTSSLPEKWKTLVVIVAGEGLGLVAMLYNNIPWTAQNVINYMIYGFMIGTTSIGMWTGLGAVNVNTVPAPPPVVIKTGKLEKGGTA